MGDNLSGNFGKPAPFTQFGNGPWPDQLWDPSRIHQTYKGEMYMTGTSDPASGKGPFSDYTNPCQGGGDANGRFWSMSDAQHEPPGQQ